MTQADPFDAMGRSFNALQGAWDQGTRNQAGRAYASGDQRGAANALATGGLVQDAADLEYRGQQRETLLSAEDRRVVEARTTALMRGLQALQGVPYEQRNQVFEQMAPMLAEIMPADVIAQLRTADKSDAALGAFGTALGAEAVKLRLFQEANGGDIIGVDERSGQERSRIQGPGPDPLDQEYRRAQIDATRAQIPLREAQAARAARPPAARGGGRSGGSARPAGSSRPASSGGSLPPGFTVRRP